MVRVISRPEVTSESSYSSTRVHYDAPALLGHVFANRVEEVVVVNSLVASDEFLLSGLLNFSEVLPVGKVLGIFDGKSLESFITSHFLERGVLKGTLGDGSTHVVDISNGARETV